VGDRGGRRSGALAPVSRRRSGVAVVVVVTVVVAVLGAGPTARGAEHDAPVGLVLRKPGAFEGYTLYGPLNTSDTYLVDLDGRVVHQWRGRGRPGNSVYLLPSGLLLRTSKSPSRHFGAGRGRGGVLEAIEWDGTVRWRYEYASREHLQHHDVEPLPNGNVLLVAWERHTRAAAIARGRDPALLQGSSFWSEKIVEVEPERGRVVWEWRVWDHLVQDRDPDKPDFGVVADSPRRMDINFVGGARDWLHANSVDYDPALDQILVSLRRPSEIWVIDHAVSTRAARGRAGDLLFRWGNPVVYQRGTAADRVLFDQHDAAWIETGLPGAGNILVFNNGHQGVREHSTVDEITPVMKGRRYLMAPTGTFLPERLHTVYPTPDVADRWWSGAISGAQRLPNGNTLVVDGPIGRMFEVTAAGEKVWEYVNPFQPENADPGTNHRGEEIVQWRVFNAKRYAPDYPGLRELTGTRE
jgi:hypothetical protein